ncbi:MAG: acyl-CoA thioesterase [Gammaproteobacteria bacterium]
MTQVHERPRSIQIAEIMMPHMSNFSGNIHGGNLLSLFDKVAYACASQYSSLSMVTLSVDQVFFKEPIFVSDLVVCYGTVNYVGNTSMEIGIRVEAQNLLTGERRHTNTCYFTMVALGENGKPTTIPPFTPVTDIDRRRFEAAQQRRKFRLEHFRQIKLDQKN